MLIEINLKEKILWDYLIEINEPAALWTKSVVMNLII